MTAPERAPARLSGLGFTVDLPPRWEGRVYQRPEPTASYASPAARQAGAGSLGWQGERPHPVLHLGNFALPAGRGDYGTGAVERMGPSHVFIALLQFGQQERGSALFAPQGMPTPTPADFDPAALQRIVVGQAGYQRFFTLSGHPVCLYVVIGSRERVSPLCREVVATLSRIEVAPA